MKHVLEALRYNFQQWNACGITLLNTFYIKLGLEKNFTTALNDFERWFIIPTCPKQVSVCE